MYGRYFLKHFRLGLHHCQCGVSDLSLDCKINFKTVFFEAVNLSAMTFVQFLFLSYQFKISLFLHALL